ncbi:DAGAT-domain-containing protein [Polychaeton citri CBS 116435]|uniref:diacylglycerol O-acyltransferase n=1 Tax=Polychaeton citri CBS 116435 TaxID=1314669 RepID=A0A9P4UK80_9PEZI|nr:DAGAT-domain-containing protein [Polychaeton citri CBS 116435]
MALTPEPADPNERAHEGLPQKSYADAANHTKTPHSSHEIIDDESVNEDAIKESPPRKAPGIGRLSHSGSEPRPLGEVMDDIERESQSSSPTLRHPRGRLEERNGNGSDDNGETYADAIRQSPNPEGKDALQSQPPGLWLAQKRKADEEVEIGGPVKQNGGSKTPEAYAGVGIDSTPRSPIRRARRKPSRDLNGTTLANGTTITNGTADTNGTNGTETQKEEAATNGKSTSGVADPGSGLVYQNFRNKSGENLTSILPNPELFSLSSLRSDDKDTKGEVPRLRQRAESELVSGRRAGAGWETSAIRWAPLNVPLQRRLQTLIVLLHTLSIAGAFAVFFVLCTIPVLWAVLVPYLLYVLLSNAHISGELSHRSPRLKSLKVWSLFASYFPARLHRSAELEPTRKYIFGYHPHGIISHGAFAAFATEALGFSQLFPGITNTLLTLDSNFRVPIYRDYALRMGLASVSRESCENLLSKGGPNGEGMGRAITIVIGGARESLDAKPGTLRLVLRKRKGFVKLAIRNGADLVPVLSFGENDLYEQLDTEQHPWVHGFQMGVKKIMGFTVPLFHARGVFNYDVGLMPYRRPINVVVGKPIRVVTVAKPDPAYVDQIHEQYCDELVRIWEEWKDTFAPKRHGELEAVE